MFLGYPTQAPPRYALDHPFTVAKGVHTTNTLLRHAPPSRQHPSSTPKMRAHYVRSCQQQAHQATRRCSQKIPRKMRGICAVIQEDQYSSKQSTSIPKCARYSSSTSPRSACRGTRRAGASSAPGERLARCDPHVTAPKRLIFLVFSRA